MRLEPWLRRLVYATLAALFASGLAWWALEEGAAARVWLIAAHGLAAMLFLLLLGAVAVLHVRESWRRKRNRLSGSVIATAMALLVLTAFGLYYLGSDLLREYASKVHLLVGVFVPALLAVHVVAGARSRCRRDERS